VALVVEGGGGADHAHGQQPGGVIPGTPQDEQEPEAEVEHAEERLEHDPTTVIGAVGRVSDSLRHAVPTVRAHLGESSFVAVDPYAERVVAILGEAELTDHLGMQGGLDPVGTGRRSLEPVVVAHKPDVERLVAIPVFEVHGHLAVRTQRVARALVQRAVQHRALVDH